MLFAITGNWVQPLYVSSQCRFCRTHDAGQECLARSSAHVLLTSLCKPRSSQCFSAFFPRCFRPHSALRSGAINSSGPYLSAFRATFAVRAKQGRHVCRAALLMPCYHIAANVSMASVPALLQASFYLCDQGQLIPSLYLLSSLYRGRNVLRTGLFADLDLRNVDVASGSVSLQASQCLH